jgi:hypothetical protein
MDCLGAVAAASTATAPATSMQVSSSLLRNTCWYVTWKAGSGPETVVSDLISFPITLLGGFPVLLQWTAPVGGVAPASYRVGKQAGCAGVYATAGIVTAPQLTFTALPPISAADCWHVTAIASDDSESAPTTPFQIPSTILGGTTHSVFGGK